MWRCSVKSTRLKMTVPNPVENNRLTDTKMFGDLPDGQFFRFSRRRRDPIRHANHTDDKAREGLSSGADQAFPAKLLCDLGIWEEARQLPDTIDDCSRIALVTSDAGRALERDVCACISLPTDVDQKLPGNRALLDRDVPDEKPQHPLAIFGLSGRSMQQSGQIPGQGQHFCLLLRGRNACMFLLKFGSLFSEFFQLLQRCIPALL